MAASPPRPREAAAKLAPMPVPRLLTPCAIAVAIVLFVATLVPDLAWGGTGGAAAGSSTGAPRVDDSGGAPVGVQSDEPRPTAPVFHLTPRSVTVGDARPKIVLRVDQQSSVTVKAAIAVAGPGGRKATIKLGAIHTGRSRTVALPKSLSLAAGTYRFTLSVTDRTGQRLKTSKTGTGQATLTVAAKPAPAPDTGVITPDPTGDEPEKTPSSSGTRFPVVGAHTYGQGGSRFGAGRTGHTHQGQDVAAAEGTPVVAPTAGTITATGYQASAAGEWVAMHSSDGRDFFFAHCVRGSTRVGEGTSVSAGTRLCSVGTTGDSSGPHLHFEIWIDGWRTTKASHPIDPLPQLKAWDAADPRS
jgi:murein DD-endopeptidase MepM/ murein hydrolase activator NlpD